MSLLVIGALHWDVVVHAPRLPHLDETLPGQDVAYQLGGKGGNQAIAAARAGAQVAFAGRVGGDTAGAAMRAQLIAAGIDVSHLQQGSGASGMSVAIVTEAGEYGAVIVSGENHAFDVAQLGPPTDCAMVLLQNEMRPEVLPAGAAIAKASGAQVVWNAAPGMSLSAVDLDCVDTLIVNRVEAADILGHALGGDPLQAVALLSEMAPCAEIILTLGAGGVAFVAPGQPAMLQPAHAVQVHSTHGAGDVFVGTYAAQRLRDASLSEAIAAGQAAAARHVSQSR